MESPDYVEWKAAFDEGYRTCARDHYDAMAKLRGDLEAEMTARRDLEQRIGRIKWVVETT